MARKQNKAAKNASRALVTTPAAARLAISSSSSAGNGARDQDKQEENKSSMAGNETAQHTSGARKKARACWKCRTESDLEPRKKYVRTCCKAHAPTQAMTMSEALKHFSTPDTVKLRRCDIHTAEEKHQLKVLYGADQIKRYWFEELQIVWAAKQRKARGLFKQEEDSLTLARSLEKEAQRKRLQAKEAIAHLQSAEKLECRAQLLRLKALQAKQAKQKILEAAAKAEAEFEAEVEAIARQYHLGPFAASVNQEKATSQQGGSQETRAYPAGSAEFGTSALILLSSARSVKISGDAADKVVGPQTPSSIAPTADSEASAEDVTAKTVPGLQLLLPAVANSSASVINPLRIKEESK
ncbi:hypothetical protein CF326_g4334 [Tilletia indica]|nr:hypothetical protein CF326_g4334 [Tilletia indica]